LLRGSHKTAAAVAVQERGAGGGAIIWAAGALLMKGCRFATRVVGVVGLVVCGRGTWRQWRDHAW
jgi:hypothetical protein